MDALPPIDRKPPVAQSPPPMPPPSPPVKAASDSDRPRDRDARGDDPRRRASRGAVGRALEAWPEALEAALCDGREIGELVAALAEALAARVAALPEGEERARAQTRLDELLAHIVHSGDDGEALARRALLSGPFEEARRVAAVAAGRAHVEGLKGLVARVAESEGPERRAAACLLAGLEREQWLELLREEAGEPRSLALPCVDEGRFLTVRLEWPRGSTSRRGAVAIDSQRFGPARADIVATPGRLTVRFLFADARARDAAAASAAVLVQRLAASADPRIEFAVGDAGRTGAGPANGAAVEELA